MDEFRIFVGGPNDVRDEHQRIIELIEQIAWHYREFCDVRAKHWNLGSEPNTASVGSDFQKEIDAKPAAECNLVLIILRGTIGTFDENRKNYVSNTAYELESSLDKLSGPKVYVFRDISFEVRSTDKIWELSEIDQKLEIQKLKKASDDYKTLVKYLYEIQEKKYPRLNVMPFDDAGHLVKLVNDILYTGLSAEIHQHRQGVADVQITRFDGNPFRSFKSLTELENSIFFGREDDVRKILARLEDPQTRFVCIKGRSGTGKSSLLQAGILPPLLSPQIARQHSITPRNGSKHVYFTPGRSPFDRLATVASGIDVPDLHRINPNTLARRLRDAACYDGGAFDRDRAAAALQTYLVEPITREAPIGAEFLIVVDQAEELWNTCPANERTAFLRLLAAAAYTERTRVLIAIRGDLFDDFQDFDSIASLLNESSRNYLYQLVEPDVSELERMITQPAARAEVVIEPGLLGAILDEAADLGSSALPLVMHTLHELLNDATDRRLTLAAYRKRGGLSGAVEATVRNVGIIREPVLHTLFDLLYDVRNGVSVRNVVSLQDIKDAGREVEDELLDAKEKLIEARVLVADDGIELAHDALFNAWSSLRAWISEHRRDRDIRDELGRDARKWKAHGKRSRHIRLRPEALDDMLALDKAKPYLFRRRPEIGQYLVAADALRQRELLIAHLKRGHVGPAMDAWRMGARLGREDRGSEPNQLRAAFHAAVTGDDRVDELYFARPALPRKPGDPSVFDDKNNIEMALSRGFTPLRIAAVFGHLDLIRGLISRGANPELKALEGSSVLHQAVYGGHLDVVKFFVEEIKIDVNVQQNDGTRPIMWAYQRAHLEVIAYLLERGARLDFYTKDGWSVLTEAVRSGDLNLVRAVLDKTLPDLRDLSTNGVNPLLVACQYDAASYYPIAELLVEKGALIEGAGKTGHLPLVTAAAAGSVEVVRMLVAKGANVNAAQSDGNTPIAAAAVRASRAMVEALLDLSANPNPVSRSSPSALVVAVEEGREETVHLLISKGADPDYAGEANWTALHYGADRGDEVVVAQLLNQDNSRRATSNPLATDGWAPLHLAAWRGHEAVACLLIEAQADKDARNKDQWTPLHLAAANGHEVVARLLIEAQADKDARNANQWAPLHLAAANGHEAVARLLIEAQADKDARNKDQWTPLHLAAANGHEAVARLLIETQADKDARETDQWTPLHLAAQNGHEAVARLLIEAQADKDARDMEGKTPTSVALDEDHIDLAEELIRLGACRPPKREPERLLSDLAPFLTFSPIEEPSEWLKSWLDNSGDWLVIPEGRRQMRSAALPFWPGAMLLAIEDTGRSGKREQFALVWEREDFVRLDWTNQPIYKAVERHPLHFGDSNLILYAKFFFHWVRGDLGRFILVESQDEIPWTPYAPEATRATVLPTLRPVGILSRQDKKAVLSATVVFKNALFSTKIGVAIENGATAGTDQMTDAEGVGTLALFDEELLIEDLPIRIDPPPGTFG